MAHKNIAHKRPWQEVALEAQKSRDDSIKDHRIQPPVPALPSPDELPKNLFTVFEESLDQRERSLTELVPEELSAKLSRGEITTMAVLMAFLRRAGIAQGLTNCITELLPSQALSRAEYLDEYLKKYGKPIGPLHGLPISVKEHIGIKGLGLNGGYISSWDNTAEKDAHILQILWNAGAVFHARTTQPQSLMHLETDSNLYGITTNPYNWNLTAGGSSGGEGALVGCRGSCLGIGTDIGGSIRSPAANNGIYGLKPTAFRLPTDGWISNRPGADAIATTIGPLSTSLTGISLFMKTVIDSKPWLKEPVLIPLPWTPIHINPTPNSPLKIAVMWHDDIVMPHPPITRALKTLVSKLEAYNKRQQNRGGDVIKIVDWKPYCHDEAWTIISTLYYPDGGASDIEMMKSSGEPWLPLTKWIIKENSNVKKLSMREYAMWQEEREAYRSEYARVWNDTGVERGKTGDDNREGDLSMEIEGMVDVIICPVGPGVAPRHNTAKYWCYTSQWNLLDYPALAFPVTKVDPQIDVIDQDYKPLNEKDVENWKLYDPDTFTNLPVSLQLVGRRFEDEKLVAVMEFLEREIGVPFVKFP